MDLCVDQPRRQNMQLETLQCVPELASRLGPGSGFDLLFSDHPPKLAEERGDVERPSFPSPAVNFNRDRLPTSLSASAVKDHLDIRMASKTLSHRLVHQRIAARNDQ